MSGLAAACAGLTLALLIGPPSGTRLRRVRGSAGGLTARAGPHGSRRVAGLPTTRVLVGLTACAGLALLLTLLASPAVAVVTLGAVVGATVARRRRSRSRAEQRAAGAVGQACGALAAEVRAGAPPLVALTRVAGQWPDLLGSTARRAALGGDVVEALRAAAMAPGAGALDAIAAAFQVSEQTGAGLADVLSRVEDAVRAETSVRRETEAHLAAVRATTRLLAGLPLLTLLLVSGGGGAPVRFLTSTPHGLACLALGAALTLAGVVWVDRMASAATRSAWARS